MITKAIEDYLKVIYQLEHEEGAATTTNLAAALGVAPASVTGMLKKLAALGLVAYTRYQGVTLTTEGRTIALRMVRYHRLAESYLADVLGMPWDEVHAEAEEWEHVLSERVVGRMNAALGNPATDPHGEPIPTDQGIVSEPTEAALSALSPGARARVSRVKAHDPALLRYLGAFGIQPGLEIEVLEVAPFEGPVTVKAAGETHSLGRAVADQIYVADVHGVDLTGHGSITGQEKGS